MSAEVVCFKKLPNIIDKLSIEGAPPGVLGIWGEWLFIFRELGSMLIILGIQVALPKSKKKKNKEKPPFCLIFFLKILLLFAAFHLGLHCLPKYRFSLSYPGYKGTATNPAHSLHKSILCYEEEGPVSYG